MSEKKIIIPYHPREPQRQIHEALDDYRFAVIIAHRRLGKSLSAILHLIKFAFTHTLPNVRMAYVAPQFKQAKSIAWDYVKQFTKEMAPRRQNSTSAGFPRFSIGESFFVWLKSSDQKISTQTLNPIFQNDYQVPGLLAKQTP